MNTREICIAGKCYNLITLKNENIELTLLGLGASIYSLKTKDKNGRLEDIVLQYRDIHEYIKNPSYFGATVGRVAGRIKNAQININDKTYFLDKNFQNQHTLHGGYNCVTHKQFEFEELADNKIKFSTIQKSSEDKFPGDIALNVTYELLDNSLVIYFDAKASEDTILNMTNHCHYNLSGDYKRTIEDHLLKIEATKFVNIDKDLIPKEIISLPEEMDFSKKSQIGEKLKNQDSKYFNSGGIDHCYIIDGEVALEDKTSGRKLKVSSSYPALQIYTCNFSRGHMLANGDVLKKYDAICFEPQYPGPFDGNYDNHPAKLKKDQQYKHFIKLEF